MQRLVIDSINYDYVPGEPESRRVWFITLRQPPYDIKPGAIIRVDSFKAENLPIDTDTLYYRVNDIYGVHVVVEPVNIKPKSSVNTNKTSSNNHNVNVLKNRNTDALTSRDMSLAIPRSGLYTYAQRPQTQYTPLSFFDIL